MISPLNCHRIRAEVRRVVLESNWAGVEEFSNHWLGLLLLKIQANSLCAETVRQLIQRESASGSSFSTGFDEMERILIESGCEISQLYHAYYLAYISAVQDATIKEKIEHSPPTDPLCLSHYSVITLDAQGAYVPVVFSVFFVNVLAPILAAFDKCTQQLRGLDATTHTHAPAYTTFLEAYRNGLAESDLTKCEDVWTDVDRKWMGTKGAIQILHDIETGYGDPLRVKATPDFSIRFLDDSFATENVQISEIQKHLVRYFEKRDTALTRQGLTALSNTMAGIFFIPFKTGGSLQFSFSGQSVPNREKVKVEKGVKIYFDAVETEARIIQTRSLISAVFQNAETEIFQKYNPNAIEQLVWHVAAHEIGHAIYNLYALTEKFTHAPHVISMLEEPRAELTSMHSFQILRDAGLLTPEHTVRALVHFACDGLRYFSKFRSSPLQPYITFQIYAFKVYFAEGFLVNGNATDAGGLVINESKVSNVLNVFSGMFERILDLMDQGNAHELQNILEKEMAPVTDDVQRVVNVVLK